MVTKAIADNIIRVIQQFEILRRDSSGLNEGIRLLEIINEMKQKLAAAIGHK